MREHFGRVWAVALALFASFAIQTPPELRAEDAVEAPARARTGILVELFTSQGCSSCPAADRLLSKLAGRKDTDVIALSFHVDYWNYVGWTDPFSSAAWSDRQRRYARGFGGNRIYTPQIVVGGRWEGVGSDRREVTKLLEHARGVAPAAEITLSVEQVSDERLRVTVNTHRFDPVLQGKQLATWIAVVESGLETEVGRGENARKTLRNDRVVRRLERVPDGEIEITLAPQWHRERLSIVAFLQDADTLEVGAVAELSL